jgi:hypothetical protein
VSTRGWGCWQGGWFLPGKAIGEQQQHPVGLVLELLETGGGLEPGPAAVRLLQMNFLTAYVLVGAAGLHASVRDVGEPATRRTLRLSPALLGLLTVAWLLAPAVLAYQVWRRDITDRVAIVVGSVALFCWW